MLISKVFGIFLVLQDGEDKYSFGKEETDHLFMPEHFPKSHFSLISKKHFIIHKVSLVILLRLDMNGSVGGIEDV